MRKGADDQRNQCKGMGQVSRGKRQPLKAILQLPSQDFRL